MSTEEIPSPLNPDLVDVADDNEDIKKMLIQFIKSSNSNRISDRLQNQRDLADLRSSINDLKEDNFKDEEFSPSQTPVPDRRQNNRRSSAMFFGSPSIAKTDPNIRSPIQVLQADIIYDKDRELKVSSLEGLQYLSKQVALLSSKYPNREIKVAHMVSYNLRPHVIAAWNSHCHKEYRITGVEPDEVMVEDWLALSNEAVHAILLESARPRTRELYSKELVIFLGKGIPQSPDINTDNFNKIFYVPLMKSLNDLLNLHDLLSEETSKHSNNSSKMPSITYGTRDSPGHIALWIISLGAQKEAVLQWLGKDELSKHKTLELAVRYVRSKLMEGRAQSEARQDLDSKLTPIKYEDIRRTQGESFQRQQYTPNSRQSSAPNSGRFHDSKSRTSFAALNLTNRVDESLYDHSDISRIPPSENENDDEDNDEDSQHDEDDSEPSPELSHTYPSTYDTVPTQNMPSFAAVHDTNTFRSAILFTFRGYCSELFVFGKCSKSDSTYTFDHSTAGQEKCIQSFFLLSKRELLAHGQLPLPIVHSNDTNIRKPAYNQSRIPKPRSGPFVQSRSYGSNSSNSGNSNASGTYVKSYNK